MTEITRKEIFAEERLTLGGIADIVITAKVAGKYMNGEEYYLHMAKRARQLNEIQIREKNG